MITELFPSLFLLRPARPTAKTGFTYLLRRRAGNVLFATKHAGELGPEIASLGGVQHVLLGDRHHALPATELFAKRCGTMLTASEIEAKVLAGAGVTVGRRLKLAPQAWSPDLEILPTPGHTRGAFSYLWTHGRRRFLFIGDTLVPIDGAWRYWVTAPNRPAMRDTLDALAGVEFDVILSNSFAASPTPWLEVDAAGRRGMFKALRAELA